MSTSPAPELSEQALATIVEEIRKGHRRISEANGYGTIRIVFERAGQPRERIIVGVETERPVYQPARQDDNP